MLIIYELKLIKIFLSWINLKGNFLLDILGQIRQLHHPHLLKVPEKSNFLERLPLTLLEDEDEDPPSTTILPYLLIVSLNLTEDPENYRRFFKEEWLTWCWPESWMLWNESKWNQDKWRSNIKETKSWPSPSPNDLYPSNYFNTFCCIFVKIFLS